MSLESYGKRMATRVYSFQAREAPGLGNFKGRTMDRVPVEKSVGN